MSFQAAIEAEMRAFSLTYLHEYCWARYMVPYECFYCSWGDVMTPIKSPAENAARSNLEME